MTLAEIIALIMCLRGERQMIDSLKLFVALGLGFHGPCPASLNVLFISYLRLPSLHVSAFSDSQAVDPLRDGKKIRGFGRESK